MVAGNQIYCIHTQPNVKPQPHNHHRHITYRFSFFNINQNIIIHFFAAATINQESSCMRNIVTITIHLVLNLFVTKKGS